MAAIGAATAFAATTDPSLRPCGDDAPALLPGSLPVSPLCVPISDLDSVITMSGARQPGTYSSQALFINPCISECHSLAFIGGYIYDDMYHTTHNTQEALRITSVLPFKPR